MPLANGATFAGYTILQLLGSGAMGEVYLVQHPRLPRHDALKVLPKTLSADVEFRQRFTREADLAAALFHPHIVGVHDRGEHDDQLWIAMDYIDGTDAAQFVRDRYPAGMPAEEALTIATAVAGALDHAHEHGLLHRDVKPANILLSQPDREGQRRIFLADFGIARPLVDPSGLTATNFTLGTVAYAAPEQLMGEDIDGRADQYALAATVFHLLTGAPPYEHSNPVAVIGKHLNAPPPKVSDRRAEHAGLDDVFSTALAKSPAERFESCGQFAKALAEHADPGSFSQRPTQARITIASAPPLKPQPDTAATKRRWLGRRTALLGAVAVVAVAALVTAGIHFHGNANHPKASLSAGAVGPAPGPTLDGTYRFVYDYTKRTINGAPGPPPPPGDDGVRFGAFRSLCTSTGCVATAAALDKKNPRVLGTPDTRTSYQFADGQWQQTPFRNQADLSQCLGVNGTIVPGTDTELQTKSFEPQPDGTLRGVWTSTVLTNECGEQGEVTQIPIVANRTGDAPPGVAVADPAQVVAAPTTPSAPPPPPPGSPVLDGTYRIEYDDAHQTVNGHLVTGTLAKETTWWAFRSSCTPTLCVAAGDQLEKNNQQEPAERPGVATFTDGQWQNTPTLAQSDCETGNGSAAETVHWSFEPQPDGTLRGSETVTILTNECGGQGNVFITPLVVTRTGDVPPAAVLADPALFQS
jgi:serine/threonine protein kinase, bacterial